MTGMEVRRKVKCCYCYRLIKGIELCSRTGVYFGRCICRDKRLVTIHHDTYNDGTPQTLWA